MGKGFLKALCMKHKDMRQTELKQLITTTFLYINLGNNKHNTQCKTIRNNNCLVSISTPQLLI